MTLEALLLAAEGDVPNPLIPAIYDIVWSIIPFALVLLLFWETGFAQTPEDARRALRRHRGRHR